MSRRPLPAKFQAILEGSQSWQDHYDQGFKARAALVLSALQHGWSRNDITDAFLTSLNDASVLWTVGRDGRRLIASQAYKRIDDDIRKAERFMARSPAHHDATEARQRVGEMIELANRQPWAGV